MTLLARLVKEGIYQCIGDTKVDYHAGLFFVYKKTSYIQFFNNGNIKYYERIEGQRPVDTDYFKLFEYIKDEEKEVQLSKLEKLDWNNNINSFTLRVEDEDRLFYVMPSKLLEMANGRITEIVIDSIDNGKKITQVFNLILV